ncbi:MAG: hypothetical protein M3395_09390 [Chloroflexota bacterium]|nr:hypothetical protein [Chloroflexota bacterium]
MPYLTPRDPHIITGLEDFGVALVEARARSAMSQRGLEFRSGVSQSVISRVERASAPRLALDRVIGMKLVLGDELPLGWCPHDHACRWQPRVERPNRRSHSGHLALLLRDRLGAD